MRPLSMSCMFGLREGTCAFFVRAWRSKIKGSIMLTGGFQDCLRKLQGFEVEMCVWDWAFRAIFARFDVQVQGWPLQHLVIGSAHLNNVVASSKRGITRDLLQQLFQTAKDTFES